MLKVICLGVAISVALQFGLSALHEHVVPPHQSYIPMWLTMLSSPMNAVIALIPGFIAGWMLVRNGVLCGLVVGFLGNVIYSAATLTFWSSLEGPTDVAEIILRLCVLALYSSLVGGAAGAWGQLVRSNNSLKSDAAKPRTLG